MKLRDICEKLKAGEIEIDTCGHQTNDLKENILDRYQHSLENENGAADGKWTLYDGKTMEETNEQMRALYTRELDYDYDSTRETNKQDVECISHWEDYCFCCGERLRYSFDGKKLNLNVRFVSGAKFGMGRYQYYNCEWNTNIPHTVEINVTDKLIFANWMVGTDADAPEGKEYSHEFELNCLRGKINIANWKAANQNIAYTQTGSCGSTSIWMNAKKDHGYICEGYIDEREDLYNEETEEYDLPEFLKGYKKIGRTDVAVWRVEMSDIASVDVEAIKKKWRTSGQYSDAVITTAKKGRWSLTSHYEVIHPLSKGILAEIRLIKN